MRGYSNIYHEYSEHKPTIHRIPTNAPYKRVTSYGSKRSCDDHCIEDQRERDSHLGTTTDP